MSASDKVADYSLASPEERQFVIKRVRENYQSMPQSNNATKRVETLAQKIEAGEKIVGKEFEFLLRVLREGA